MLIISGLLATNKIWLLVGELRRTIARWTDHILTTDSCSVTKLFTAGAATELYYYIPEELLFTFGQLHVSGIAFQKSAAVNCF